MRETTPNKPQPQRCSSIRLRRRRDEVKQQFVKNRRSGEFGYRIDNNTGEDISDNFDNTAVIKSYKDDTLDPGTADNHIKHNLRPLIRNKFKLTDFGLIDSPAHITPDHLSRNGRRKTRESLADDDEDDEEDTAKMSMNCFSGNVKTLEKENYSSLARRKRAPSFSNPNNFPLHRSLMWLQKGKLLTRWKERFIVITEEYIQCFKKGLAQLSQMGDFIFQFALKDVRSVSLVDRRGYLTVVLEIDGDLGLVVRKPEGLRDWYNMVQKQVKDAKARVMLSTEQFWNKKSGVESVVEKTEEWLVSRRSAGGHHGGYHYSDRPASVASVDRRQQRYRRQYRQQYNDYPDESSTLSKLSKKSKPRSKSVERNSKVTSPRSASVSEDSGNSSLNTYTTDTIQTNTSDWIKVPRGYNMGWY